MLSLRFMLSRFYNAWFPFLPSSSSFICCLLQPPWASPKAPQLWDVCCCSSCPSPEPTPSLLQLWAPISYFQDLWFCFHDQIPFLQLLLFHLPPPPLCFSFLHPPLSGFGSASAPLILLKSLLCSQLSPSVLWPSPGLLPFPRSSSLTPGVLHWCHHHQGILCCIHPAVSPWVGDQSKNMELLTILWAVKDQEFLFMRTPDCI